MMNKIFFSLILFVLTSCAGTGDLRRGGGGTQFSVRGKTYSQVWKAANAVMSRQLTIVMADKPTGTIKAEKGAGMMTWGEVVGVFITPQNETAAEFSVEVQSEKRSQMQITGQDWKQTMVQGIKAELGID